ncbi:preprotein translocase subunit SecE [Haliangium ochraceum]|uniref:Protein translocase subunit SecE n=1 Tax=Haliangium ochraceum (strain DSM 14365 / JCM 11303 / SMP-2) TaxID=502025 RepID=D0LJE6_HALO1|nr:preprotein translocase subunit SecE [Haliangium ochraceum]ACY16520.1 preprotein translocase, SecE subunit [Haliangium ochraceum DSM 14365]
MAQDNAPNKPVHLIYLCGGLLFFYLLQWTLDWVWGYFSRAPSEFLITVISAVIALFAGVSLYRNERVHGWINEVTVELKKVAWPGAKEVRQATIVVIVMTLISATILGAFDYVWANLTDIIYG